MISRALLSKILIGIGLLILLGQGATHLYLASRDQLPPFEDGKHVVVPFIGTVCLGAGIFMIALGGNGRKDV